MQLQFQNLISIEIKFGNTNATSNLNPNRHFHFLMLFISESNSNAGRKYLVITIKTCLLDVGLYVVYEDDFYSEDDLTFFIMVNAMVVFL